MIPVGTLADIPVGEGVRVAAADGPIAVFRVEGDGPESGLYAVDDTCPHQRASLADGFVEGGAVECPLHAVCFDLRSGEPDGELTHTPVRTHQVVVVDGTVYVRLSGPAEGAGSAGRAAEVA
ncbi:MAG TPA: bifunctional 3-phenylpropionate/cinnamic acid dioxygenase ferredoxin subunit [Pseudonocardia sp.]|jgi:3-phenylpropionate/trans-cinnamate dioxygenase ferredoxin subunit